MKQAETREILRSQVKAVEYNPRVISAYARKQLKISLTRFGLVETLVWNERTGNLVSGHQRLGIMDEENGYPGQDYKVTVSVVKLTEKRERQLNVWLNNRAAQGSFDRDKLHDVFDFGITLKDVGLTLPDLSFEFGSAEGFDFAPVSSEETETRDSIEQIKQTRKTAKAAAAANPKEDADYYVLVVFGSKGDKAKWLKSHGFAEGAQYLTQAEAEVAFKATSA